MGKPLVVAEIGINHNGDINKVKDLIRMAKRCGADAVKFQKRSIHTVYTSDFLRQKRESPWGDRQFDQKMGLELAHHDYETINNYCDRQNMIWFASAWDKASFRFIQSFNCRYNKIASAMISNEEFVRMVAEDKRITFISTGLTGNSWYWLDKAVDIFREVGCQFVLMHCVGLYPCPDEHLNISLIPVIKNRYQCPVGYSGHSAGIFDGVYAHALGAEVIEKHITLDRTMYGSDQVASIEEPGLRKLVEVLKFGATALGDGKRHWAPGEKKVAEKLRWFDAP